MGAPAPFDVLAHKVRVEIVDAEKHAVFVSPIHLLELICQIKLGEVLPFARSESTLIGVLKLLDLVEMYLQILPDVWVHRVKFQVGHQTLEMHCPVNLDQVLSLHYIIETAILHLLHLYDNEGQYKSVDKQRDHSAQPRCLLLAVALANRKFKIVSKKVQFLQVR